MEFGNPIVGTEDLIRTAIKSPNYEPGIAGWIIRQDGTAEFLDLIARGSITANELNVLFTNQDGDVYTVNVGEANPDQPGILFEFDGTDFTWRDGSIKVEAFDTPGNGRGEMRMEPLQPTGAPFLGSPPGITLQSHATSSQAGLIQFTGSNAVGSGLNADRPTFVVDSNYRVLIEALRTFTANLESDSGRVVVNDTTFGADFVCETTMDRPGSGILTVELWTEIRTTVGTGGGLMGFEVRDTDASGTVRLAASDARAVYSVPNVTGFHSTGGSFTDAIAGTSGEIFIRLMFRCTTAATTINFARCRMAVRGSA